MGGERDSEESEEMGEENISTSPPTAGVDAESEHGEGGNDDGAAEGESGQGLDHAGKGGTMAPMGSSERGEGLYDGSLLGNDSRVTGNRGTTGEREGESDTRDGG